MTTLFICCTLNDIGFMGCAKDGDSDVGPLARKISLSGELRFGKLFPCV